MCHAANRYAAARQGSAVIRIHERIEVLLPASARTLERPARAAHVKTSSESGNGCHGLVAGLRTEASLGTRPQWHHTTLEGLSASSGCRWVSGPAAPRLSLKPPHSGMSRGIALQRVLRYLLCQTCGHQSLQSSCQQQSLHSSVAHQAFWRPPWGMR